MKTIGFKIGRITGMLAALGTIAFWLIFLFANPYSDQGQATDSVLVVMVMLLLSVLAVLASLAKRPYLMAFLAAVMLVPVGLYTLGTPGLFRWIGFLEVVYFAAALLMIGVRFVGRNRPKPESLSD